MGDQPGQPFGLVNIEPAIHTIGVAGPQQAVGRHGMGAETVGNFKQGTGALAHIGARIVVTGVEQFRALGRG